MLATTKTHRNKKQKKYNHCMAFHTVDAERRINRNFKQLMIA
jgi:hypothetical protein